MELGIPDLGSIDIIGASLYFLSKIPVMLEGLWNTLLTLVESNPIVTVIIIVGLSLYVGIDLIYHYGIDNPTRKVGQSLTAKLFTSVIFMVILALLSMFMFA